MKIKVRREPFGIIAFNNKTRKHFFLSDELIGSDRGESRIRNELAKSFEIDESELELIFVGQSTTPRRLSAPLCLYLEILPKCSVGCAHCYKPEDDGQLNGMEKEDFFSLLEQANEMGVFEIRLCGNEPTISPFFKEICEKIKDLELYLSVNTSGIASRAARDLLLFVRPDHVIVSVDGVRETHDSVRFPGAWDRAVSLLKALRDARIERRINCVLSTKTIDYIDSVVALAKEVDCGISFIPLRTMGKPTSFKEDSSLTREEMFRAVKRITALKSEVPIETFFDILGNGLWTHHTMDINTPCPAGKNGFVSGNGQFFPCDWIRYLGDKYLCGDVKSQNLLNIWENSSTLQNFQQIERRKCKDCPHYLKSCYGGCWCSYGDSMACGDYEDRLCFLSLIT